ncbi:MAG: hypothetical protein AABY15_04015 [Nanoarchaeota archaeon]
MRVKDNGNIELGYASNYAEQVLVKETLKLSIPQNDFLSKLIEEWPLNGILIDQLRVKYQEFKYLTPEDIEQTFISMERIETAHIEQSRENGEITAMNRNPGYGGKKWL